MKLHAKKKTSGDLDFFYLFLIGNMITRRPADLATQEPMNTDEIENAMAHSFENGVVGIAKAARAMIHWKLS